MIDLRKHRTKVVCTIGPASESPKVLEQLIRAGMDVARLNFAHGTREDHRKRTKRIRAAAARVGRPVAILADLPGPKLRIGMLEDDRIDLKPKQIITLTTRKILGTEDYIPVSYKHLAKGVKRGSLIYLNDGFIQLRVLKVEREDVRCEVTVGGPLRSFKGMHFRGPKKGLAVVSKHDLDLVKFGKQIGVDAFGVSYVSSATDLKKVRALTGRGLSSPLIIAKIEREEAVTHIDSILAEADALMVARGDLGVELPIADLPIMQKKLITKANLVGKPVITATQMLESMIDNIRPTRAEVTDVANAILDGTDAIMLSGETAVGAYPVEAVKTMAEIAKDVEPERTVFGSARRLRYYWKEQHNSGTALVKDTISLHVVESLENLNAKFILTPTPSGGTACRLSRFKPHCWILAFSPERTVCHKLCFSSGVHPVSMKHSGTSWDRKLIQFVKSNKLARSGDNIVLTEGKQLEQPTGTNSMKIITLL